MTFSLTNLVDPRSRRAYLNGNHQVAALLIRRRTTAAQVAAHVEPVDLTDQARVIFLAAQDPAVADLSGRSRIETLAGLTGIPAAQLRAISRTAPKPVDLVGAVLAIVDARTRRHIAASTSGAALTLLELWSEALADDPEGAE